MRKSLYLIGAGDLGREMESWLGILPDFSDEWMIKGYFDINPNALDGYPTDYKIIGDSQDFDFSDSDYVLLCLTDPEKKMQVVNSLRNKVKFYTYIAPNATIGKYVKLGQGVVICPNVCLSTNVTIGDFVFINAGSQIGHDCKIGSFSSFMAHVDLGGKIEVGNKVYLGTKSSIIPGMKVSDNIRVGSGSVVIKNLEKPGTYFGNPAVNIGF